MHVKAVEGILEQLELGEISRLLVLNKADNLDPERRMDLIEKYPGALVISAVTGEGLTSLALSVIGRIDWSRAITLA